MRKKRKINLAGWIIICLFAGILVGFAFLKLAPESTFTTDYLKPLGTIYINLLKFMVVPVVVFSIMDGVISLNDLKRVGSLGIKTIVYYILTTAFIDRFKKLIKIFSTKKLDVHSIIIKY